MEVALPAPAGPNPFVGPQSLETGQRIFGRDREIEVLYYQLSAERIVLLHSPSGAGKSSLIRAGLMPRLQERFDVWGPTRVNTEPAAGGSANRYVRSAVLGFEQGLPEARRRSDEVLSAMSLAAYVAQRPRRRSAPKQLVLIFDQFEEILTADPLALDAKREFFRQLGELLQNPDVWALFALREDYLAALDPYAYQMPTQLKNRFRLDLLGREAAEEAMVGTAAEGGRSFAADAVKQLAQDLATMQVQQPDGRFEKQVGPHVEPLHLQVACRGLWERMPADDPSIDLADIANFGSVDRALANYYEDVVGESPPDERAARAWVGDELITPTGIRSQVLRGVGASGGLYNDAIARLVDAHLVRGELRGGAVWYELAHDRLVEPVRTSNAAWFAQHLQPLQRDAALWARAGKPERLLLRAQDLARAEAWAASNAPLVLPIERDLLERSARQRRAQRGRQGLGAGIVALLMLGAGYYVREQQQRADNERAVAEERRLNIVALNEKVKTLEQAKVEAVAAQRQQTVDLVAQREANAAMKTRISVLESDTQRLGASVAALRDGNRTLEASIERHELEHGYLEDRIKALDESITTRSHQGEAHWERAGQLKPLPDILAAQGEALSRQIDALTRQEFDLMRLVRQSWPCNTVELVEEVAPASMVLPMGFNSPRKALAAAPPVPSDPGDSMRLRARIDELARELAALLGERARLTDEASWLQKEATLLQQQLGLLTEEAARLKGVELTLRQRQQALGVALARAEAERQSQLAWIAKQEIANAGALSYLMTAQTEHDRLESRTIAESSQIGGKQQKVEKLQDLVRSHTATMNPFVESLARAARSQAASDLAAMLAVKAYRWAPFDTNDPDRPQVYNTLWSVLRKVDPAAALALVAPDNLAAGKLATTRSEVMVSALCSRVGRPLTLAEWISFVGPACYTPQTAKVCEP
jgi:hypothetical protein